MLEKETPVFICQLINGMKRPSVTYVIKNSNWQDGILNACNLRPVPSLFFLKSG